MASHLIDVVFVKQNLDIASSIAFGLLAVT